MYCFKNGTSKEGAESGLQKGSLVKQVECQRATVVP